MYMCVCVCSLKPLDIEFMKQLHHLVNIIPVIAKADTLTAAELKALKLKVRWAGPSQDLGQIVCLCVCAGDE